jgi:signal transduction histidine kinase
LWSVLPLAVLAPAVPMALALRRDIDKRRRAEAALWQYSQTLKVLSHRLVGAQETERRHLARELHDEVGQNLTVAEMNIRNALKQCSSQQSRQRLKEALGSVELVLDQVRDLSLELRPSMLDDLGLEPTLRWYMKRQAESSGINANVHADHLDRRLDSVIETECFRVTQEAVNNVVKHANANSVSVDLHRRNGNLDLFIRDDGVGFDVNAVREQAVQGASLGLLSMEERAALAGGGLEYKSKPGEGTEVHAWFPIKWQQEEEEELRAAA